MRRMNSVLVILLLTLPALTGCVKGYTRSALDEAKAWIEENRDKLVADAKDAGEAYVEKKLAEGIAESYQEALIFAEENGIPETKVDPNMNGKWDTGEQAAWGLIRAKFVSKDMFDIASQGFLRGEDKDTIISNIKEKYPDLWEAYGGSGIMLLLGLLGFNRYRNGTRKKEIETAVANGHGNLEHGTVITPASGDNPEVIS